MKPHSESARQWVHIGAGVFALFFRWLSWQRAAAFALLACVFNVTLFGRVGGRRLYRPEERDRGYPTGILLYPLSVLGLILFFRARLDLSAAAWGILAAGDGAATLVGFHLGGWTWPWNHRKTVIGSVSFIFAGTAAAAALMWWIQPVGHASLISLLLISVATASIAALAETLPIRLDDNLTVPVVAAAVLWLVNLMDAASVAAARVDLMARVPAGLILNGIAASLGFLARTVVASGAISGAFVGAIVFAGGGIGAWAFLFATFLTASVVSRIGLERKVRLGIAEERHGRRGAGNVIANCGVAAAAAAAAITTPFRAQAVLALVAALSAGGSDTVASEIGKAWGRRTYLISSLRRVEPGTPGAISVEGTAAGLASALALAALGVALGLIRASLMPLVVLGATAGSLVESVLGATLESSGIVNNDVLNFINTAVAALVAVSLW